MTNDGTPTLKGVNAEIVGTVDRVPTARSRSPSTAGRSTPTSATQEPGQWKGQNVSGKWFVIEPTGKKNLTCLPKISKPVAPPADEADAEPGADAGAAGGGDYSY